MKQISIASFFGGGGSGAAPKKKKKNEEDEAPPLPPISRRNKKRESRSPSPYVEEYSDEDEEDGIELFDDDDDDDGDGDGGDGVRKVTLDGTGGSLQDRPPVVLPGGVLLGVAPRPLQVPVFSSDAPTRAAFRRRLAMQEEREEREAPAGHSNKRKAKVKFTPGEQQYLKIKAEYPDVLLLVETGYKYYMYEEDAVIGAQVLNFVCYQRKNFRCCGFPVERLDVHSERLVKAGYKVGIVKQTETAALKASSSSKGKLFSRAVESVVSQATMIEGATESVDPEYLVAIVEQQDQITLVAVSIKTGRMVSDVYLDSSIRLHTETRLAQLNPCEILLSDEHICQDTLQFCSDWAATADRHVTLSHCKLPEKFREAQAVLECVRSVAPNLDNIDQLAPSILLAVALTIQHLTTFKFSDAMQLVTHMEPFVEGQRQCMLLEADTCRALEIFNLTSGRTGKGTLFHLMNRTRTGMGHRMLREWISAPLMNVRRINSRLDAVAEIISCGPDHPLHILWDAMAKTKDIEIATTAIFHRRSTPCKYLSCMSSISKLLDCIEEMQGVVGSPLLQRLVNAASAAGELKQFIGDNIGVLDATAAEANDYIAMFVGGEAELKIDEFTVAVGEETVSTIAQARIGIMRTEGELKNHLEDVRRILDDQSINFKSVSKQHFLIEVKKKSKGAKRIPEDWDKRSTTKAADRYHSPECNRLVLQRTMYVEALSLLSKEKWRQHCSKFIEVYPKFRSSVLAFAELDCLCSLAVLAKDNNYVKPEVVEDDRALMVAKNVRNAVAEHLCDSFISNDVSLEAGTTEALVLTGPNMGGKSTYTRGVAMLAIMAQIGSFVSADSCKMTPFDGVFTRMGSADNLGLGHSTFMNEALSVSELLSKATRKSLCIIDELGRGTSTYDGVAIAHATLDHLATAVKCFTLFVTHFPSISSLSEIYPTVCNAHMGFLTTDNSHEIVLLYKLVHSAANKSYGLNVARLAFGGEHNLDAIVERARHVSELLEQRDMNCRYASVKRIFQ